MSIIKCPECNRKISDQSLSCPKCGRPLNNMDSAFNRFSPPNDQTYNQSMMISSKSRLTALLLCFFLGLLGIHRFYVEKTKSGIAFILIALISIFLAFIPLIITIVWCFIDFIMILCGTFTDNEGFALKEWT